MVSNTPTVVITKLNVHVQAALFDVLGINVYNDTTQESVLSRDVCKIICKGSL